MQIKLAKSAGFCFGVRRAINLALKTARENIPVYMLGELVHNTSVIRQLAKSGIKKVDSPGQIKGDVVILPAHGTSKKILKSLKHLNLKIVDATCPMVKEIHRIAEKLQQRNIPLIIIADKEHPETKGIVGQLSKKPFCIIQNPDDPQLKKIKNLNQAAVIVQSTQDTQKVRLILNKLQSKIKNLEFYDTICGPTKAKQGEARKLALHNNCVIVIGAKHSANTKRLYEIAKSLNPKTYWVEKPSQINRGWFKGINSVGVTAGASTPEEIIQQVLLALKTQPQ